MDNVTAPNLNALKEKAQEIIAKHDDEIDELCHALTASAMVAEQHA